MKILVLAECRCKDSAIKYWGTDRGDPPSMDQLGDVAKVNQLRDWYIEHTGTGGFLAEPDLQQTRELLREYERLGVHLQLVELASTEAELRLGHFIGYDLSYHGFGESLLSWGLALHDRRFTDPSQDPDRPITLLIERYFQPKLNAYGLFDDQETTVFLHEVLVAYGRLRPGYLEAYIDEFEPVALGLVDERPSAIADKVAGNVV